MGIHFFCNFTDQAKPKRAVWHSNCTARTVVLSEEWAYSPSPYLYRRTCYDMESILVFTPTKLRVFNPAALGSQRERGWLSLGWGWPPDEYVLFTCRRSVWVIRQCQWWRANTSSLWSMVCSGTAEGVFGNPLEVWGYPRNFQFPFEAR